MVELEFDRELIFFYPVFALGTAVSLGIISADILPFVNMSDVLLTLGGADLTVGRVLAIGALAGVVVNRDSSLRDNLGVIELWVVYATVGLLLAPPFFPIFQETLVGGFAGVVSFLVQSIGFTIVSYIN